MSTLLLIRHAQARAFDTDSDRLSEQGALQARRLGEHLASTYGDIDEVHLGTLVRQRHTAELVAEAFAVAGRAWPEPRADPAWNEYDAGGILGTLLPLLAERDPVFGRLALDFHAAKDRSDRNRYFQRMFESLMDAWEQGSIESEGVERFGEFHGRVRAAFEGITSRGGSRRV